jgi:FkbM family methyltransferase
MGKDLTAQDASTLYERLEKYSMVGDLFEDVIQELYSVHLRPGEICVDGGANQGCHAIRMAELIGHGKVHAYEPIPEVAQLLFQNAVRAEVSDRIDIHVCALADAVGVRDFVSLYNPSDLVPSHCSGLRRNLAIPDDWACRTIRVPVTTLDCSLAGLRGLAFIKLDLEGGEYHALLGGANTIESHRPLIAFENNLGESASLYQYSSNDFFGLLERLGYGLVDILGTTLTREIWDSDACVPWYWIAYPRELGRPDWMTCSINAVLQRHGFPSRGVLGSLTCRVTSLVPRVVRRLHRVRRKIARVAKAL